jgi:hypothetical protein
MLTYTIDTDRRDGEYSGIIERIRSGDVRARQELSHRLSPGIRWLVSRSLPPESVGATAEDALLTVFEAIQDGAIHEPERLLVYVRTTVRIQILSHLRNRNLAEQSVREEVQAPAEAAEVELEMALAEPEAGCATRPRRSFREFVRGVGAKKMPRYANCRIGTVQPLPQACSGNIS